MTQRIDAYITVRFRTNNLIDEDALQNVFGGDLSKWVRELMDSDGLWGMVEDEYDVVSIEQVQEDGR